MKKLLSLYDIHNVDSDKLFEQNKPRLADIGVELDWTARSRITPDEAAEILLKKRPYGAILDADSGDYGSGFFEAVSQSVRYILFAGCDVQGIDWQAAQTSGIEVELASDAYTDSVAEYTIMLMLGIRRKLVRHARQIKEETWHRHMAHQVSGNRIGLIGFGAVGRRVAALLTGFACDISACDPFVSSGEMAHYGVRSVTLPALLAESDLISLHASRQKDNAPILDADALSLLPKSTSVINTAHGSLIDEEAFVAAMKEKRFRSAGLDVFAAEPIPRDHPFMGIRPATITPRAAGYTYHAIGKVYDKAFARLQQS